VLVVRDERGGEGDEETAGEPEDDDEWV